MKGESSLMHQSNTRSGAGTTIRILALSGLLVIALAACAGNQPAPASAPTAGASETSAAAQAAPTGAAPTQAAPAETAATETAATEAAPTEAAPAQATPTEAAPQEAAAQPAAEIVVYVADLAESALSELDFIEDSASPGGKLIGLPNNGDELDPPPENDPYATFEAPVQPGIPYRCWVHMKVGAPKGKSQANVAWVQFADSVDKENREVFRPSTKSYLTAQGPTQEGWTWVPCDVVGEAATLVYFAKSGTTVRVQAGAEGVGFDQVILSPSRFLEAAPAQAIVEK
jgi:hypothetical protein